MERILVARPDRIGDVVLSTPVFWAIKLRHPQAHLTVAVRASVAPLLAELDCIDELLIFDPEGTHAGREGFGRLVTTLKHGRYDAAVVLQSHRRLSLAIRAAGISLRIGPLSRPHSYLAFNRGIRQHRSTGRVHEADYNLALLRPLGIDVSSRQIATTIALPDSARQWARSWVAAHGQPADGPGGGVALVVVHPGMGGSALNWPEENYRALVRALVERGRNVIITAGVGEGLLARRIANAPAGESTGRGPLVYEAEPEGAEQEPRSLHKLAALLAMADLVIAPSTGPLHMAVALKRPVLAFYPDIRAQSVLRWGPYHPREQRSTALVPVPILGTDPTNPAAMKGITVEWAMDAAEALLTPVSNSGVRVPSICHPTLRGS